VKRILVPPKAVEGNEKIATPHIRKLIVEEAKVN